MQGRAFFYSAVALAALTLGGPAHATPINPQTGSADFQGGARNGKASSEGQGGGHIPPPGFVFGVGQGTGQDNLPDGTDWVIGPALAALVKGEGGAGARVTPPGGSNNPQVVAFGATVAQVPEPAPLALLAIGLVALGLVLRPAKKA